MNETTVENMTTIGTVYESMMQNQRTYLANPDNKHRLEDECTDFSLNTSRNGVGEVSKRSRSKSKFSCKYGGARRDREPWDYNVRKSLKCSKRASQVENVLSVILCTIHHIRLQWKTFYPLISEFTLQLDCVEVDLLAEILVQLTVVWLIMFIW